MGESANGQIPAEAPGGRYKWVALSNTTLGMLSATVNASIVIISLPAIFRGIHLNPLTPGNVSYLLWMLMGYLVVSAVLVVTLGRLGDIYGRVRMYNLGFAVFALGAPQLALPFDPMYGPGGALWLIGWRVVQATGGAMLMANSPAILTDAFPADQRGTAMGINQVAGISGTFIGLILGGILAAVDWRLVFIVSVPSRELGAREDGIPMSPEPGGAMTFGAQTFGAQPSPTVEGAAALALAEPAVNCDGVTYRFGDHVAVDHVDLTIQPGETFGLLGPNGAGKTTTIRMLVTLLKPMDGRISVFGADAASQPMRVRRMIGYVPQLLSADGSLTGRENVELFARLFDVPHSRRRALVEEALAAMGLTEPAGRLVKTYSGGMVRRLELAQALVNAPRLLVLDEPTVGLDPIARSDVWDHITRLRERAGMTVLMTTHHMEEADLYCDRVSLMHSGRVQATDSPANLKALLGPDASLDEVFRHFTGGTLDEDTAKGGIRDVRRARRTARRLG